MVCYNITAYNEIINFTVSKREVYNSKLRAGIKAERGMVMKGKNLERAVILGLILSAGVYGTAWASAVGVKPDGTEVKLNKRNEGGLSIGVHEEVLNGDALAKYDKIVIKIDENATKPLDGIRLNANTIIAKDIDITIKNKETAHGIYLSRHGANADKVPSYLEIGNYTANISAPNSNAFEISCEEAFGIKESVTEAKINGNFTATVENGNGIKVSSSSSENLDKKEAVLNIKGKTDITINADIVKDTSLIYKDDILVVGDFEANYAPAGIYAGNTTCNFEFKGTLVDIEVTDPGTGQVIPIYNEEYGKGYYHSFDYKKGLNTEGLAVINLDGEIDVKTNGKGNFGIYAGKNGEINLNANGNSKLNITASGTNSYGIAAINSNLVYGDKIDVWDEWGYDIDLPPIYYEIANTVLDQSENTYGSTVILNGTNNTITMAEGGKALYADAKNSTDNDKEVIIKSGVNGIGNLDVKGDVVATNSGKINLKINDWADVTGDIEATNKGEITFNLADEGMMFVSNQDNNVITGNGTSAMALNENGTAVSAGNVQAANGGVINVNLGAGSYFEGRVDDYKDADSTLWNDNNFNHDSLFDEDFVTDNKVTSSGTVNMNLGNNAVWNLTQQSWVTNLSGNGTVVLVGEVNDNSNTVVEEGTGGYAVHIGKLEGNNTFLVNLNPEDYAASDMIYIYDGSTAGVQNLRINNEAEVLNALKDDGDRIRFATVGKTAGAGAGFGDDYVVRGRGVINSGFSIDYVDYDTDTDQGNYNGGDSFTAAKPGDDYVDSIYGTGNKNSETSSQASTLENNAGTGNKPVAELDSKNLYLVRDSSKDAGKSDSGATIINMSRANYKNAIYMDRLNKRMGEMRYVNGEEEQGLWVRLRHDRIGQSGDFRSMNTMYEVGYDVKQSTDNGEHRIGMAIDYMRGSTTYDDIMGKGETKRYGLWLYDTWLGEKGHYTDYIVKWGHLSNDFDIRDKDSLENITGDYSNNVFSVSAEYGKKNDMGNNWYFEPQAQLQLARVTGADYVTTQGSKVNVDGINSLIGRAGFRIGRDMDENSTVYLKADLLHEFMGDQTVTAADATGTLREEFENKGTWYDIGFGFAAKMSKNSYAFMDFEKSFGNDNDETYQINAGMQWTF